MSNIKVRIAPSPTGNLHIGTARSALFNWLFARHYGGQFVIRIEDTDLERSKKEYEKNILDGLKWLGLESDVPIVRQTERLAIYRGYLEQLLNSGKAFWCHHTIEELDAERERQLKSKEAQRHLCDHKNDERGKQKGQIIRLAVPWDSERTVKFNDNIRGPIEIQERLIGDLSLAKNLDTPLYNFAVVIDDLDTSITHVMRGEEHISNTPKQLLIYSALDAASPQFAHMPLILNPDKTKLSKRAGATSVDDYRKDYLPAALINFIGFLGYTYSKELINKEEMVAEFDLVKVHKSGAVFNIERLNWLNAQYLRRLSPTQFKELAGVPELSEEAVPLAMERLEKLSDIEQFAYFWKEPEYETELLRWKNAELHIVAESLRRSRGMIENVDFSDKQLFRHRLDILAGQDRGLVYWPLRVALTGVKASPDPVDVAFVLGRTAVIKRIDIAIHKISNVR